MTKPTEPDLYVYKLTVDDGGAPCATADLLTLAICKPDIRSAAEKGAIIFGLGSVDLPLLNRLVYVAVITGKQTKGAYYSPENHGRPDCIYEWKGNKLHWRNGALFHKYEANRKRDIGEEPDYRRANVLLSTDFRYLGDHGTDGYKKKYPAIKALAEKLRQGHRLNHANVLRSELLQLKDDLWSKYPDHKIIGLPCQPIRTKACGADEEDCCISICERAECLTEKEDASQPRKRK